MDTEKVSSSQAFLKKGAWAAVIVAALGYFVDVYDLLIFSILRVPSLKSLGVGQDQLLRQGVFLLNAQMTGMIIGGVLWGVLGDKRGRLSVLLGSIFLYSFANIANGFVTSMMMYGVWRFLAGLGLAGELGAGITLVSELMSKEHRGLGTTLVASIGVAGAIFAAIVGESVTWQKAYFIGGFLGLVLLVLRVIVHESKLFDAMKSKREIKRGNLFLLFKTRERTLRYLSCICAGLPIWYAIGILITFAPEFGRELGVSEPISAAQAVLYAYIGLVLGDLVSGLLSQWMRSRKKVILLFVTLTGASVLIYLFTNPQSAQAIYWLCLPVGFGVGYWSVFVTMAAEQFGTNLRATVATTVPNFVRGAVVPITSLFELVKTHLSVIDSALIVGILCFLFAYISIANLRESFGKSLEYTEQ